MASFVRDIMDPDPPTVGPEASVEEVVDLIGRHDASCVLVVNEGQRCIGIITEADLVIGDEEGDLHIPHYIELFGGVVFLEPLRRFETKLKKAFASKARDLMTEDPVTAEVSSTPREAAKLIVEGHHNRLPVVEHGRLVGLVTRADVLGALVHE
jgi:CBS domain-containing protein